VAVIFSKQESVATVTLNRPEAMNALDPETWSELLACWEEIRGDDAVRAVILTGAGERAFCAGADLKKTMPQQESFAQLAFGGDGAAGASLIRRLETDKPVLCAINGVALGGGLELALSCDIRLCATPARFGLTEVRVGSIPGAGGTQRLPRIVGLSNAMLMLLTGEPIDSAEALRIGLVSRVTAPEVLLEEAATIAAKIVANAPLAVRAVKRLVTHGADLPLQAAIDVERLTWGVLRDTEDRIEGRLAFQQKRKPIYRGR
jgi:E-phenylitaconyl-CoA hydratase